MRVGIGYDVHSLVEGRTLIIGGVNISFEKGLKGHSDADVLVHAVMDALLGAAGMGDIGKHFPSTDDKYKGISSLILLRRVGEILYRDCYKVENIDGIVVGQLPKLAPYVEEMELNIARTLGIHKAKVNIKATTTEGLGFVGVGDGMAAYAVALLSQEK
jgi:2-C-methyl-D-erythritol 2,4-cyclodiphosphate synthase